jgi:hypothetical protein
MSFSRFSENIYGRVRYYLDQHANDYSNASLPYGTSSSISLDARFLDVLDWDGLGLAVVLVVLDEVPSDVAFAVPNDVGFALLDAAALDTLDGIDTC